MLIQYTNINKYEQNVNYTSNVGKKILQINSKIYYMIQVYIYINASIKKQSEKGKCNYGLIKEGRDR